MSLKESVFLKRRALARTFLVTTLLSVLVSLPLQAQTRDSTTRRAYEGDYYGPQPGDWELTLGGSGSNDKKFKSGGFAINAAVGYFFTEGLELSVRQDVGYSSSAESSWSGSTRGAIDYHFNLDRFRPFLGANIGGFYGEDVETTGEAGLEAGLKYYVKPKTFILAMMEYQWFFKRSREVTHNFDDGRFVYTLGIGFNF